MMRLPCNTISDALGKIIENRTFDAWENCGIEAIAFKHQIGGANTKVSLLNTNLSLLIDRI